MPTRDDLDVLLMTSWGVGQQEWQWIAQDIEGLAPKQ